jgi:hypothetical protein
VSIRQRMLTYAGEALVSIRQRMRTYTTIGAWEATLLSAVMCPHTTTYASAYHYICVLILLYMLTTTIYVSSYYYICVRVGL